MTKWIIVFVCLLFYFSAGAQTNKIEWISFEEAVKRNETNPKKIIVDELVESDIDTSNGKKRSRDERDV